MNAVLPLDHAPSSERKIEVRRVSRFLPRDPAQVAYRRLVSALDEDALLDLETDIEHFLACGVMTSSLSGLLSEAEGARAA